MSCRAVPRRAHPSPVSRPRGLRASTPESPHARTCCTLDGDSLCRGVPCGSRSRSRLRTPSAATSVGHERSVVAALGAVSTIRADTTPRQRDTRTGRRFARTPASAVIGPMLDRRADHAVPDEGGGHHARHLSARGDARCRPRGPQRITHSGAVDGSARTESETSRLVWDSVTPRPFFLSTAPASTPGRLYFPQHIRLARTCQTRNSTAQAVESESRIRARMRADPRTRCIASRTRLPQGRCEKDRCLRRACPSGGSCPFHTGKRETGFEPATFSLGS